MPTIEIHAPPLSLPVRRAIAVRLTRWFSTRGVPARHVVVRFTELAANSLFTGGMAVEALDAGPTGVPHASIVCRIGPDRDEEFRADLAGEIAELLGFDSDTSFLYVEFRQTRPEHVYVGSNAELRRADAPHRA